MGVIDRIIYHRRQNRPTKWIARATGVRIADIRVVLRLAGLPSKDCNDLEQYDRVEELVRAGAPFSEIRKITGMDWHRVTAWFPDAGTGLTRADRLRMAEAIEEVRKKVEERGTREGSGDSV